METRGVSGVNHLGQYGRWDFAAFTDVYEMETDFAAKVEQKFKKMIDSLSSQAAEGPA